MDSNGKGYIELYDYQGKYTQNIEYKTNQVVYEDTTVNGKTVRYYYRFKRTYDFPSFKRMTLANVYTAVLMEHYLEHNIYKDYRTIILTDLLLKH